MTVFGGILLFTMGVAVGGGAVSYHQGCIRAVEKHAAKEKETLRNEVYNVKFRTECDRAWREGYANGCQDPLTDAERLARTFRGRRVDIRSRKEGA